MSLADVERRLRCSPVYGSSQHVLINSVDLEGFAMQEVRCVPDLATDGQQFGHLRGQDARAGIVPSLREVGEQSRVFRDEA